MQQSNASSPSYRIAPATVTHVPQITAIVDHYILHTTTNFAFRPLPEKHYQHVLVDNYDHRRLPFLVAIEDNEPANDNNDTRTEGKESEREEKVIGFTTVTTWIPSKLGYAHTLELSLYISPAQRGCGVGTALLTALIAHLENNEYFTFSEGGAPAPHSSGPNEIHGGEKYIYGIPVKCKQLLALMAVDEDATLDGQVCKFYERRGFESMGILKGIGWKFGKRRDVRMLSRELNVGCTPEDADQY
ncbi:hypothetical protein TWF730_010522 [Orbilia blumenaviensis]|uniref:N-acetyltransferase domain-containing protein n=1 Tax=Orbilia blumenaviensis TaxID=1796055 RepID=A0AAV9UUS3_9PEZI